MNSSYFSVIFYDNFLSMSEKKKFLDAQKQLTYMDHVFTTVRKKKYLLKGIGKQNMHTLM